MALPPLEIRYKRSIIYLIVGVFSFVFIMLTFTMFLSDAPGAPGTGPLYYLIHFTSLIILALAGFTLYKRYSSPKPVLVFDSYGLQIPRKNNRNIYWDEITEWKIKAYKSNYYLIIHTSTDKTRIDISWLELPVKEIRRLMETYVRRPGPNYAYN